MKLVEFGMDTVTLAGPLEARLAAMRGADLCHVMLSAHDLVSHPQGIEAAIAAVRDSGLRPSGFKVLRDFEGLSGNLHAYKVDIAKSMLEMCAALGCKVLLAASSTSTHAATDAPALARDLKKLAMLALPLGIQVAYEAMSWGRTVNDFRQAWELIVRADATNLGIAISSSHVFAAETPIEDLDLIDPWRIYAVRLSDVMWQESGKEAERGAAAGAFRVFPGEGVQGDRISALVLQLDAIGYRGGYTFDVFNRDYQQMPLETVAARARRSALWLAEDVLQRSTPLPMRIGGKPR